MTTVPRSLQADDMRGIITRSRITPRNEATVSPSTRFTIGRSPKPGAALAKTIADRGPHSYGYSKEKFLALQRYTTTTSPWRVAAVILITPIPGLVGALLPSFVPLQDPLAKVGNNPGYLVNIFIICFVVHLGTLLHWRAGSALPSRTFTWRQLCLVVFTTAVAQGVFAVAVSFLWRFPTPMSWIVSSSFTSPALAFGCLITFRERCWQDKELIDGMKVYAPALLFQCLQIVLYPAFSVLFGSVTSVYQVLLTLVFPLIKYLMKKGLRRYTRDLHDFSNEVAVTGIEICASLYQSMILQNAPSQVAFTIIMAVDVLQGLLAVKFFMDRPSVVPQNQVVREALDILSGTTPVEPIESRQNLHPSRIEVKPRSPPPAERTPEPTESVTGARLPVPPGAEQHSPSFDTASALQLVGVAESILLVEYLEVAIPIVNTLFVAISCQFSSAQYNPHLRKPHFSTDALSGAMKSMLLYSLLQALSFVAMHLVMRYRYGLSAVYQLAFILEYHWWSIVGKMVAWLPIILHFTVVHFGVDFSFRFDFAAIMRDADQD